MYRYRPRIPFVCSETNSAGHILMDHQRRSSILLYPNSLSLLSDISSSFLFLMMDSLNLQVDTSPNFLSIPQILQYITFAAVVFIKSYKLFCVQNIVSNLHFTEALLQTLSHLNDKQLFNNSGI